MLRKIAFACLGMASLIALTFSLAVISKVGLDDVAAHYGFGAPETPSGIVAGDLYAISPDGQRKQHLCKMELLEQYVSDKAVETVFTNVMAETMPVIVAFYEKLGLLEKSNAELPGGVLAFRGRLSHMQARAFNGAPADCEAEMIEHAMARFKLCLVNASLVPESATPLSAFRFEPIQIVLPAELFARHGHTKPASVSSIETLPCPGNRGSNWDVRMRRYLGVVHEASLPGGDDELAMN